MGQPENIHPVFDRVVGRAEKEARLRQRARVIWLYGLSGSGKSTLAIALERQLQVEGFMTHLLDGDNVRTGLNRDLGFSEADRGENIRRVAEVAKLFVEAGVIVLCSFITPLKRLRSSAEEIIGKEDFIEVYIHASFEACALRDPKGLYAKAGAGGIKQFTGQDAAFELPPAGSSALVIDSESAGVDVSLAQLYAAILPRLRLS